MICPRCLIYNNIEREMRPLLCDPFGVHISDGCHLCDSCGFVVTMSKDEAYWEAMKRLVKRGDTPEEAEKYIKEEMQL